MANVSTVVNGGLALITGLMATSDFKYVTWGTDGTEATAGDTDMTAESAESRTSGTQSQQTTNTTNDTYRCVGLITATDTRTIYEVGIFDASTSGNMFMHANFGVNTMESGDSMEFTINTVLDQA